MGLLAGLIVALALGFAAYVRFAPSDPARWHVDPSGSYAWDHGGGWGEVIARMDGAILRLPAQEGGLERLDAIAMATPRSTRLAGSVAEGRITWVIRSALWGFPDYITAQQTEDGIYIDSRLRFGKSDLGVNAKRLQLWLEQL